ncbi:SDR family NAD(P)-dependent oxidoreductase [Lentzea sp. NPDC004789]
MSRTVVITGAGAGIGAEAAQRSARQGWIVCATDVDETNLRHARTAPRREVRLYAEDHFDIYLGEAFERVVADQLAFLTRHVPVTPAPAAS